MARGPDANSFRLIGMKAIIVVPEKSIGSSFHNEPLSQFGFWADWEVAPQWNLCNAPGGDIGGKVEAIRLARPMPSWPNP